MIDRLVAVGSDAVFLALAPLALYLAWELRRIRRLLEARKNSEKRG